MQRFPLAILFVVSFASLCCTINVKNAATECPPVDIIKPCTCKKDYLSQIDVECSNLRTPDTLKDVFARMPNWYFYELSIHNSSMLYIPSSIFQNASFEFISLKDSSFTTLFDKPLSSESLRTFGTHNVILQRGIDWNLLSKLKLNLIHLDKTLRKLDRSFRESVPETLKEFHLHYSNFTHFQPHTFLRAKNLEKIFIHYGDLQKLDYDIFPKSIKTISINYHRIQTLPEGVFKDLPNLSKVFLRGNLLTTIQKEVFFSIKEVFIHYNPIKCDCSLHWILKSKVLLYGKCAYPSTVKGKSTRHLTEEDFKYCGP